MNARRSGALLGCLVVGGILATGALGVIWFLGGGVDWAPLTGGRVGLVRIEGTISDVDYLVEEIEENRRDKTIDAVVIRIDSPGGGVASSQELYEAISRLRMEKPVVASLGSVAASGGYYAAVAADSIVANPGTLTGSIGVILDFPTARDLMEKLGIRYETFKSGALKDMGTFAREPTEEEEAVFDGLIADVYDQFVEAVADGRGLSRAEVERLADGRVFSGRQAKEVRLVDTLGDLHAAVHMAGDMAGIGGEPRVVSKARALSPLWLVLSRLLQGRLMLDTSPGIAYRLR